MISNYQVDNHVETRPQVFEVKSLWTVRCVIISRPVWFCQCVIFCMCHALVSLPLNPVVFKHPADSCLFLYLLAKCHRTNSINYIELVRSLDSDMVNRSDHGFTFKGWKIYFTYYQKIWWSKNQQWTPTNKSCVCMYPKLVLVVSCMTDATVHAWECSQSEPSGHSEAELGGCRMVNKDPQNTCIVNVHERPL